MEMHRNEGGAPAPLVALYQIRRQNLQDTAMREGRQRPSLSPTPRKNETNDSTAMREGRQRPSLRISDATTMRPMLTAMREGRQRPSLPRPDRIVAGRRCYRNEGGAPAPLVEAARRVAHQRGQTAMREGRQRPSLQRKGR